MKPDGQYYLGVYEYDVSVWSGKGFENYNIYTVSGCTRLTTCLNVYENLILADHIYIPRI